MTLAVFDTAGRCRGASGYISHKKFGHWFCTSSWNHRHRKFDQWPHSNRWLSARFLLYSRHAVATHCELSVTRLLLGLPPTLQHVYSFHVLPPYGVVRTVIFDVYAASQENPSPLPAQQSCPLWPLVLVHLLAEHLLGGGQHLYSRQVLPAYRVVWPVILGMNPVWQVKGSPLPAQQSCPPWPSGLVHLSVAQSESVSGQHVYFFHVFCCQFVVLPVIFGLNPPEQVKASPLPAQQSWLPLGRDWYIGSVRKLRYCRCSFLALACLFACTFHYVDGSLYL